MFICLSIGKSYGQRYAVVDTKYILSKIPEYQQADETLKLIANRWQKELSNAQIELDRMRKNYEAEQYMLSDELKKKREIEISNKEKLLSRQREKYFGYEGEIFQERKKLVQPIQDKIYNAVQHMMVAHGLDIIFDKSDGTTILAADPKLNRSDEILSDLGIKIK
ncbi:OmpH family outer membrane protein [Rhizosphaericola mali]|uniref:OmpH family outer membrane protein n=1 Tax=Rhizosphaericola mali TaxID=2545455 RepID=UPI001CD9D7FF|nr:OmpH family outer membrane protein [Rhizosphaericola mali]